MPTRQELLDLIQQRVGYENYQKYIDNMGGEDQLWTNIQNLPGGADALWQQLQENSSATSSNTSSSARSMSSSSSSSSDDSKGSTVAFWLGVAVFLLVGILTFIQLYWGNSNNWWGTLFGSLIGGLISGGIGAFYIVIWLDFFFGMIGERPSREDYTADKIAFWMAFILVVPWYLLLGIGTVVVYLSGDWESALNVVPVIFVFYYFYKALFVLFLWIGQRLGADVTLEGKDIYIGWILGVILILGIIGGLLYGLFKLGIFAAGSVGTFFKWLFEHFF